MSALDASKTMVNTTNELNTKKNFHAPPTHSASKKLEVFLTARQTFHKDPELTHTLFTGAFLQARSPFKISDQDKNEFFRLYTACYDAGVRLPFIEMKPTRKWPFFMDCDGKPEKTQAILKHINKFKEAIRDEILPNALQFVFDLQKQVTVEVHEKQGNNTRFHIYLKNSASFVMDSENSVIAREKIIELSLKWSEEMKYGITRSELSHFFDPIMTNSTGLRMYGSKKPDPSDTDYVQHEVPVSVESLGRYTLQPQGIANEKPLPTSKKAQAWWKTVEREVKKARQRIKAGKAVATRTEESSANTTKQCRHDGHDGHNGDPLIIDCAKKLSIPIAVQDSLHRIRPNNINCPVCKRMHESENAFLFRSDIGIKCFCYRAHQEHFGDEHNPGNSQIEYITTVELFPKPIPQLEGLLDQGAMYWAEYLLDQLGPKLRICGDQHASFFVYKDEERLWVERDGPSLARKLVYDSILPQLRRCYDVLKTKQAFADNPQEERKFEKAIYNSSDPGFLQKIVESFKSFDICQMAYPAQVFNQLKEDIAVKNGVINLKTLTLRERTREDLFTIEVPYTFTQEQLNKIRERSQRRGEMKWEEIYEDAKKSFKPNRNEHAPEDPAYFDQLFYGDVFELDRDLVPYVQRVTGVGLTGCTERQTFEGFYGGGSNFKSMLKKLLELAGEYCKTISYDSLCVTNSANNDELYHAQFARVLTFAESNTEKPFNWFEVLRLTGNDKVAPAAKFLTNRQYTPMFNIIGFFNDPPPLPKKINFAHTRRIRKTKMRKIYLAKGVAVDDAKRESLAQAGKEKYIGEKDPNLEATLMNHAVGWLLWQMEGAHYYLNHGKTIPSPESMEKKLKKEFVDDDYTPAKFLAERYEILPVKQDGDYSNDTDKVESQRLFNEYKKHDGTGRINEALNLAQFSKAVHKAAKAKGQIIVTKRGEGTSGKSTFFLNLKQKEKHERV